MSGEIGLRVELPNQALITVSENHLIPSQFPVPDLSFRILTPKFSNEKPESITQLWY
jgi:hypothetical protein